MKTYMMTLLALVVSLTAVEGMAASADWPNQTIQVGSNPYVARAAKSWERGNYEQVIALYGKAIHRGLTDQQQAAARNIQCVAARELGQLGEAQDYCEAALEINSNYWKAHVNLGYVLKAGGDSEGALNAWCEAHRIAPSMVKGSFTSKCALA